MSCCTPSITLHFYSDDLAKFWQGEPVPANTAPRSATGIGLFEVKIDINDIDVTDHERTNTVTVQWKKKAPLRS